MMKTVRLIAVLAGVPWAGAAAQGYFDFDSIPGVPEEPSVQVDLDSTLLGFAAGAARTDDPDTAEMLEGIDNIRVRVYESLDDADAVSAFVDDASGRLERDGWQRVVAVNEDGEKVRVYVRMEGQVMNGMTVMVLDSGEAVFINIAGRIDPELLGGLAGAVGVGDIIAGVTGRGGYGEARRDRREAQRDAGEAERDGL